jgi:hypothetical protein
MIKTIILFLSLLALGQNPDMENHYNNQTWDVLLKDVKMRYKFSVPHNSFMQVPRFGNNVKELHNKEIVLRGFFLPADVTGDAFVLSYVPMQMCFFCAGSGIESVVELNAPEQNKSRFRRLNTDNFIEVRGKLRLNASNLDHLIYILDDAELVKVIR